MKKGLCLTLTLITIALLCTSAYSVTLNISSIPDIIISDTEDNTTIDNNFFRMTGEGLVPVLDFDNKVKFSDGSSSESEVKWSFVEYADEADWLAVTPTGDNWIAINDQTQNTGSIWESMGDAELRQHGSPAEFRNIKLSPLGDSAPFDPPDSAYLIPNSHLVELVATYKGTTGNTSDTETIIVYAEDGTYDHFSEIIVWNDDEFGDHSTASWNWTDLAEFLPVKFPAATSSYEETSTGNGDWALALESTDTTADGDYSAGGFLRYGTWFTPYGPEVIDYTSEQIYKARWSLVSSQSTAIDQPAFRVRYSTPHGTCSATSLHQTDALNTRPYALSDDPGNLTELLHYWYPAQFAMDAIHADAGLTAQYDIGLAVDMHDGRPASVGKMWVANVDIIGMNVPDDVTPVYSAPTPDAFSATDWGVYELDELDPTNPDPATVTSSLDASSGLTMGVTSRTGTGLRMALWTCSAGPTLAADKLYRLTYTIKTAGTSDVLPTMRARVYSSDVDLFSSNLLVPNDAGGGIKANGHANPGTTEIPFVTYLPIEAGKFTATDKLWFSLDMYGGFIGTGGDGFAGTYYATTAKLEVLTLQ